jgi:hypothetical protein
MIVKALVTIVALLSVIFLGVISNALIQPIWDNIEKKKVEDFEGKILGYAGFAACGIIFMMWYHYIFG